MAASVPAITGDPATGNGLLLIGDEVVWRCPHRHDSHLVWMECARAERDRRPAESAPSGTEKDSE